MEQDARVNPILAAARLMDQNQLQLAQALKQGSAQNSALANFRASLRDAFLSWKENSLQFRRRVFCFCFLFLRFSVVCVAKAPWIGSS